MFLSLATIKIHIQTFQKPQLRLKNNLQYPPLALLKKIMPMNDFF